MYGAVSGKEPLESAWEAQMDIEQSSMEHGDLVVTAVDYQKYFDSFPIEWIRRMLEHIGIPAELARMHCDL